MRTKTLLLTAVLGALTVATASAQVYSVNAVGYVNVTVPANAFAILANPLNQPTNNLQTILPDVPANTIVYKFVNGAFLQATKRASGSWTGDLPADQQIFNPGEGFFIKAGAADLNITFVGEVMQGDLSKSFPAGFSLMGSMVPQTGKLETDLKLPAVNNTKVHLYTGTGYDSYTRRSSGAWTGGSTGQEPVLDVAKGFFYEAPAAGTWARTFSVNQ